MRGVEFGFATFFPLQLHSIGDYFTRQLLESRHRGAFELAYAGFVLMAERLWSSPAGGVHELPRQWLDALMSEVRVHDPADRLCSTRRSAGVPFYVQVSRWMIFALLYFVIVGQD